jgi:hypothetical protein
MKMYLITGLATLALGGGAALGITHLMNEDEATAMKPLPTVAAEPEAKPKPKADKPEAKAAPSGPTYKGESVTMIYNGPTVNLTWIDVQIQQVEISSSRTDVVALLGEPDWSERQSTDFGYDVFLWYGDWAVSTSDGYVTGVTWYG